jgi:hypothetical protein
MAVARLTVAKSAQLHSKSSPAVLMPGTCTSSKSQIRASVAALKRGKTGKRFRSDAQDLGCLRGREPWDRLFPRLEHMRTIGRGRRVALAAVAGGGPRSRCALARARGDPLTKLSNNRWTTSSRGFREQWT